MKVPSLRPLPSTRKRATVIACLVCVLLLSAKGAAAPMAYFSGGAMAMLEASDSEREASMNYSLTPRDALGVRIGWMESSRDLAPRITAKHAGHGSANGVVAQHESAELTYTRLLKRWNAESAQTNIWLFGGMGALRGNTFSGERFSYSPGAQVDFETTRLYASAKVQMHRARGINNDAASVRLGASLWEADYEDTQPWIVVEAKRTREFSEKIEITPMLRLIHRKYFAELGVNQDGKVKASLMIIFDLGR
jgi:hypothetical protein